MVAALSGAPTRPRRSCKHRTSRWMARHGEIRVPSILAAAQEYLGGKKTVIQCQIAVWAQNYETYCSSN
jgi:hypothetical protein